jgi:hypothetical protein
MRLWHLIFLVMMSAIVLTVARESVGRVAIVVFVTGFIEFVLGTTFIMTLFRTFGAIGEAERLTAYLEAILATAVVLVVASYVMNLVLWAGVWLVQRVV